MFSSDPDADREFLADARWSEPYFMRDDFPAEVRKLEGKNVRCSAVEEARWGSITKVRLPGGGEVGLYEPKHAAMVEPGSKGIA